MLYAGFVVLGIVCLFLSRYISGQVEEGRGKIDKAQSVVDQGNSLFSLNPVSKEIGKGITGSMQNKIDAGSKEADFYESMAMLLRVGGIVLIASGAVLFIYHQYKKRA